MVSFFFFPGNQAKPHAGDFQHRLIKFDLFCLFVFNFFKGFCLVFCISEEGMGFPSELAPDPGSEEGLAAWICC